MGLRIRSIKPEILTDEKSAALTDTEWRLFVSCIVMSDDYGNFRASPGFLHSQAFWSANTSREDCERARETLARLSLVLLYTVGGQTYGHISGWAKHQKVDHPGKPSCPGPEHGIAITYGNSSRGSRETVEKVSESLAPDRDRDRDQDRDQEKDPPKAPQGGQVVLAIVGGETKPTRPRKRAHAVASAAFEAFWQAYPQHRHVEKAEAIKAWPGDEFATAIMAALAWQTTSQDWTKEGGTFVPHPKRYLAKRRWTDEKPQPVECGARY